MSVKQFIESEFLKWKVIIMVSLDIKGALDVAWGPAALELLRNAICPQKLYQVM